MIYDDQNSSSEKLLEKDNSFTFHHLNIHNLQDLLIVTIFAQKLILLFRLCVQFIMVKVLCCITVTLSGT